MKTIQFYLRYRLFWWILLTLVVIQIAIIYKWKWFCIDFEPKYHINKLCNKYKEGHVEGTLCSSICKSQEVDAFTCHTHQTSKEIVFNAYWKDAKLIIKSVASNTPTLHWFDNGVLKYPNEKEFLSTIRAVSKNMLNQTLSMNVVKRLAHLRSAYEELTTNERQTEMDDIWVLVQDNEYLLSNTYKDRGCFPQIIGTCGPYFAVEYIPPIPELNSLLYDTDTQENWNTNLKYAVAIMELLEELENNFKEPLYICDIKLRDFGLTRIENGRAKVLDLDSVYSKSVISRFIGDIKSCEVDEDCRLYDCRGKCNKHLNKCDSMVSNNNLQIVCEKLFLGWKIPNTLLIPGLLLSQFAPVELMVILRQCANPSNEIGVPKGFAGDDLRKRLYSILVDIDQSINMDYSF